MVGVPGRSKGCNTCRRRKKGCDARRPACSQCCAARLVCEGYERGRVFVHTTPSQEGPSSNTYKRHLDANGSRRITEPARPPRKHREPAAITLPESLARSAYEDKDVSLFWTSFLPYGRAFPPSATPYSSCTLAATVQALRPTVPILRRALLALSLACVGRADQSRWMAEEGLRVYVFTLQEMAAAVRERRCRPEELLVIAKVLSWYEVLVDGRHGKENKLAQAKGWRGHNDGQKAIITSAAPGAFADGLAHDMFVDGRMYLIISAITDRRRCFLSEPMWMTVPWTKSVKTPKDRLLDIMVQLPGLFEDLDRVQTSDPGNRERLRSDLLARCWMLDGDLVAWAEESIPPDILVDPTVTTITTTAAAAAAAAAATPPTISVQDLAIAHLLSIHAATAILLYSTLQRLVQAPLCPASAPPERLPPRADPQLHVGRIVRLMPLLFHPDAGLWGGNSASIGLGVALTYLSAVERGPASDARVRLAGYLARPKGTGSFLMSLQREMPRRQELVDAEGKRGIEMRARAWMGVEEERGC